MRPSTPAIRHARAVLATLIAIAALAIHPILAHADSWTHVTLGAHRLVDGHAEGRAVRLDAGQFTVEQRDDHGTSTTARAYCIDIGHPLDGSLLYAAGPTTDSSVAWILTSTPPAPDPTEAAAVQAAIWHFTDGFTLGQDDLDTSIAPEYARLVAEASGRASPIPTVSVSAATGRHAGEDVTVAATVSQPDGVPVPDGTPVTLQVAGAVQGAPAAPIPTRAGIASITVRAIAPGPLQVHAILEVTAGVELLPPAGTSSQRLVLASPTQRSADTGVTVAPAPTPVSTGPTARAVASASPAPPVPGPAAGGVPTPRTGNELGWRLWMVLPTVLAGLGWLRFRRPRPAHW